MLILISNDKTNHSRQDQQSYVPSNKCSLEHIEDKENGTHPIRQDARNYIRPRTENVVGVVVAYLHLDCGRLCVRSSMPIFIEMKNQKYPLMPISESAAN